MFRKVPLSIIRSFALYTQQWYMSHRFADSLRAGSGRLHVSDSSSVHHQEIFTVHTTMVYVNCPKRVEFYSKNKFEKIVHLFGFIIRSA